MEKVETENELGFAVYINGKPNLTLMPQEEMNALCSVLLVLMEKEVWLLNMIGRMFLLESKGNKVGAAFAVECEF